MFKNRTFNLLYFVLLFLILSRAFYLYIGIISPGGKLYSKWLETYANLPAWITYFICKSAKAVLELCGYNVYQKALNNVTIRGSRGVNIIWACLGAGVISFWMAFVTAHYADWKYKLKWIIAGVTTITVINIIRIALIALALHLNWKAFNSIEPHFAFNVVSYIAIFLLTLLFVVRYKNYKNFHKLKAEQKNEMTVQMSS